MTADEKRRLNAIKEAAKAHSTLNAFAAVQALLEGGIVYDGGGSGHRTKERIIAICKIEGQRQLRRYDRAIALAQE